MEDDIVVVHNFRFFDARKLLEQVRTLGLVLDPFNTKLHGLSIEGLTVVKA